MTPGALLVAIVIGAIFGIAGHLIGKPKGYPVWGFFLGFFLSIIGLIVIAVWPAKKR